MIPFIRRIVTTGLFLLVASAFADSVFIHPGLLQSQADIDRMKQGIVAKKPVITAGFAVFRRDKFSQSDYVMRGPGAEIGRSPSVNFNEFNDDAAAAYQNALMWCLTGEKAHAEKTKEILDAWSSQLQRVTGRDGVLMAGLGPFEMINAAELIRYSDAGWPEADARQYERVLTNAICPEIKDFALFANGNWDAACEQTMLAIGVFCNNRALFERALRYYCNGGGNGRLTHYIINEEGQAQESGRDQQHTQLGLALLGDCCQVAWSQGLDLYGCADNRLLKGFDYTAKYLLGEDVPFSPMLDRTGKYPWEKISVRSPFRPIYEQVYNHYVEVEGLPAPFVQRAVLDHLRPEGALANHDNTGFGTLLYARSEAASESVVTKKPPAAPAAIVGFGSPQTVRLTWIASIGAASYTIKRSTNSGGPYITIARDVKTPGFTDDSGKPGAVNYYVVAARNEAGESPDAPETGVSAGPPTPWSQQDIGAVNLKGDTQFDGRVFTLEGAGTGIGGPADQFQFASQTMNGDGEITARFVPQMSAALSSFGLTMRGSLTPNSPHASLLITAQNRRDAENSGYFAQFQTRASLGAASVVAAASPTFGQPYSDQGRMLGHCWLRLARRGDTFTAAYSADGKNWTALPSTILPLQSNLLVGLAVSSTNPKITTTVMFDNVSLSTNATSRP